MVRLNSLLARPASLPLGLALILGSAMASRVTLLEEGLLFASAPIASTATVISNSGAESGCGHSIYMMKFLSQTSYADDSAQICFQLSAFKDRCDSQVACCRPEMDLLSLQLDLLPICQSSLRRVTLNGIRRDFEFSGSEEQLTIHLNDRKATISPSAGFGTPSSSSSSLCLVLVAPCNNIQGLCADATLSGRCRYSVLGASSHDPAPVAGGEAKQHCCAAGSVSAGEGHSSSSGGHKERLQNAQRLVASTLLIA